MALLATPVKPDYEALLKNLRREGAPERVHYMELFLDWEVRQAIVERFGVLADIGATMVNVRFRAQSVDEWIDQAHAMTEIELP